MTSPLRFEILKRDAGSGARVGRLYTAHGIVETPAFMPVGTLGTVKAMTPWELTSLGAGMILANAYHLFIRPGVEVVGRLGGLHQFMGWSGPILTDSGGYQVYSLSRLRKVDEDGVEFRSHLDGRRLFLSPEGAIDIQHDLASDVAMVLDDCIGNPSSFDAARASMIRSMNWAQRCRNRFLALHPSRQALFGIVQGAVYPELRMESVQRLKEIGFEGYAIGGLGVGEPVTQMYETVSQVAPELPSSKPRYLMGVGTPADLIACVARGVDMFDCVMPTRHARNGWLFTAEGHIVIRHSRYKEDPGPIDANCSCPVCARFSRAYLRHLFISREILSGILNTIHNLSFYLDTMRKIRHFIESERFSELLTAEGAQ